MNIAKLFQWLFIALLFIAHYIIGQCFFSYLLFAFNFYFAIVWSTTCLIPSFVIAKTSIPNPLPISL